MKNKCASHVPDIREMIGNRMMFRCYRKVIPEMPHDIETLIDSHDDLFIIPCKEAETFKEDAWTWMAAINSGKVHNCNERNGDRRIEITGKVEEVKPHVLILSELEYAYKDDHLSTEQKNPKDVFSRNLKS